MTALPHSDEASRLASEHGLTALIGGQAMGHGWALVQIGQTAEGLSETLRPRAEFRRIAGSVVAAVFYLMEAETCLAAGCRNEGLETVGQALQIFERAGIGFSEAEMRRLKGELLLIGDGGAEAEAEECFREAIEVARKQSAKSWELRTTMSLTRLLMQQGRREEARAMLAAIYGWFTEGFDTADLKDAKALFDELAG